MKEFMFYIRNMGDAKAAFSPEKHLAFVKKCEVYIDTLRTSGRLIAAQPITRDGVFLSKSNGSWLQIDINLKKEVQVGYYHIKAKDQEEAVEIAKQNPEFEYVPSARIEIHEIKIKEKETGFVYPK